MLSLVRTAHFEPPAEFDDYVILAPIGAGQGRMGQLYLAEDTVLARHVAVKFVDAAPDLAARQRFLNEARTAARVQHPNVVTIHRVGELGDRPYLVTEFVRGKSLAELERPVTWRRALTLGIDLARGLAAAHRHGVVHCDIKPANAMVAEDGAAKLVDFGLATLAVDEPGPQAAAAPRGTPDFMAPEVWDLAPPTRRSDVYSLGAVLYELVAGRTPHGDVPAAELPRAARERDAPPLAAVAPSVDPRFAAIVDRCLARDPGARFPSGEELRHALERLERAADGGALPVGNPYRGLRPFEPEQRGLFFGRGVEVGAVVDRLRLEPFVLVTGDSGVGKSSLLRAGVLPAVRDGALGGGRSWRVAQLVPGTRPLAALREALVAALGAELDLTAGGLGRELSRHLGATHGVVIFLDQLEELLTVGEPEERAQMEQTLAELADGAAGVRLLATLRADFLSRFASLPHLGQDVARVLYFVRPLPPERIRDVIIGPAQAIGARFETEEMVDELIAATAAADGGLPLLSFALAELWEARDVARGIIPAAALAAMGGVAGALARHADATVAGLPPDERAAARRVLGQLVTPSGTRARRPEAALAVSPAARAALAQLVRGRLVVAHDADDGSAYELAHEVLIDGWGTLRRWRAEDAVGRALRERLGAAAEDWARSGRPADALWSGRRLAEAESLDGAELPDRERDFLRAARRAELRRKLARTGLALTMVLLIVGVYGGLKLQARSLVAAEVEALHAQAAGLVRLAQGHEARRDSVAAAAYSVFDAGERDVGEATWSEALAARGAAVQAYAHASRVLEAALAKDAERGDTRALLAEVLYQRALLEEDERDPEQLDEIVARFRLYDDDGHLAAAWESLARITVASDPAGAVVSVDGRWVGATPMAVNVRRGAHVVELTAPGRAPARLALLAHRGEPRAVNLTLPPAGAVPAGYVYVPAGSFLFGSGGDEAARRGFFDTAPIHERTTAAYLIGKTEVTFGEWLAFVDALPPEERDRRTPGVAAKVGGGGALSLRRTSDGWELTLQPLGRVYTLGWGVPLVYEGRQTLATHDWRRLPVTGVSAEDAEAYAAWLRETGTLPRARLCSELEWERAARGADDRVYPNGMTLAAADANFDETHGRDQLGPDSVGSHPGSDSPYGLSDMSGNAFEWTTSVFVPGQYVGRGGSFFYDRKTVQVMNRAVSSPEIRDASLGVRMCAEVE